MDGPGMDSGWTWDGLGRDPGGTLEDPGWTMDGPGMDITHLYLTIFILKENI